MGLVTRGMKVFDDHRHRYSNVVAATWENLASLGVARLVWSELNLKLVFGFSLSIYLNVTL